MNNEMTLNERKEEREKEEKLRENKRSNRMEKKYYESNLMIYIKFH